MSSEEKKQDNKLKMNVIVNGKSYEFTFPIGNKFRVVVEKVLKDTETTGQSIENWELRDTEGNLIDLDKHIKDYEFTEGVNLFLNPKAGIGG